MRGNRQRCAVVPPVLRKTDSKKRPCRSRAVGKVPPGCGSQHPLRTLSGARVLLAAAPTAPPCFSRWLRSSPLHLENWGALSCAADAGCRAPQFSRKLTIKKQLCQGRAAKFAIRVKSALAELRCIAGRALHATRCLSKDQ